MHKDATIGTYFFLSFYYLGSVHIVYINGKDKWTSKTFYIQCGAVCKCWARPCALCTVLRIVKRTYTWMSCSRLISLCHLNLLWSTSPSYAIRMNSLNWHLLAHTNTQMVRAQRLQRQCRRLLSASSFLFFCRRPRCYCRSTCVCICLCLRTIASCKMWERSGHVCVYAFHSMIKLSFFPHLFVLDSLLPSQAFNVCISLRILLLRSYFFPICWRLTLTTAALRWCVCCLVVVQPAH